MPHIEDNEDIEDPANGADADGLATALVIEVRQLTTLTNGSPN